MPFLLPTIRFVTSDHTFFVPHRSMTRYNHFFFCLVTILQTKSERLLQAPTVSHRHHIGVRSWGPVVVTEIIGYGLNSRAIVVRFPTGARHFYVCTEAPTPTTGPSRRLYSQRTEGSSPGVKRPKREADHSPHVMPKWAWDDSSNSSHAFMACTGASHFHRIRTTFLSCQLP
jgi:hypothetical protein